MALNLQTLKTRTGSAIIFVIVMIAGLLWSNWSFLILFSCIHFGCWYEYRKLHYKIYPPYSTISSFHRTMVPLLGFACMLFATNDHFTIGSFTLHALGWWIAMLLLLILPVGELLLANNTTRKSYFISILGLLYISLSWALMLDLSNHTNAWWHTDSTTTHAAWLLPVGIIVAIWINDTMAYIVGSLIGKTKLTTISPNKTWEGTLGGIVLAVTIVVALWAWLIGTGTGLLQEGWWKVALLAAIAAITGTFGDLLESWLKRKASVKDSGSILPGHGGFLDRFDSLLIAVPFVWLYIKCLKCLSL